MNLQTKEARIRRFEELRELSPELDIICVNKFIGRCPQCTPDYDPNHAPNNFDCSQYQPMRLYTFEVR